MRNSQVVFRAEQFFVPDGSEMPASGMESADSGAEGHGGAVPDQDTRRLTAGWNYWLTPAIRASVSFGRSSSTETARNVWTFGLTYRFAAAASGRTQ